MWSLDHTDHLKYAHKIDRHHWNSSRKYTEMHTTQRIHIFSHTWIKGQVLVGQLEGYLRAQTRSHFDNNIRLGRVLDPESTQGVKAIEIDVLQNKSAGEVDELKEWSGGWRHRVARVMVGMIVQQLTLLLCLPSCPSLT
jgi:hypothetical protein